MFHIGYTSCSGNRGCRQRSSTSSTWFDLSCSWCSIVSRSCSRTHQGWPRSKLCRVTWWLNDSLSPPPPTGSGGYHPYQVCYPTEQRTYSIPIQGGHFGYLYNIYKMKLTLINSCRVLQPVGFVLFIHLTITFLLLSLLLDVGLIHLHHIHRDGWWSGYTIRVRHLSRSQQ